MQLFYPFYDRSYGYARAIVTLILGLVLIIWPEVATKWIITIIGAFIMAVGIVSITLSSVGKWKTDKGSLLAMNGLVDIVFGLLMLIFPTFFSSIIVFLFGFILILFGLGEIVGLVQSSTSVKIPWRLYIGPVITTICGVVMFFRHSEVMKTLFLFFGIALLIYSITEFISTFQVRKLLKDVVIKNTPNEEAEKEKEIK